MHTNFVQIYHISFWLNTNDNNHNNNWTLAVATSHWHEEYEFLKKFESKCELSLLKDISYLESVPSFIISEDNKLKYNMQCFRNVA